MKLTLRRQKKSETEPEPLRPIITFSCGEAFPIAYRMFRGWDTLGTAESLACDVWLADGSPMFTANVYGEEVTTDPPECFYAFKVERWLDECGFELAPVQIIAMEDINRIEVL